MHQIGKEYVVLQKLLFQTLAPKGGYAPWIKCEAVLDRSAVILHLTGKIGMVCT